MLLGAFLARHKRLLILLLALGLVVGALEGSFILLAKGAVTGRALFPIPIESVHETVSGPVSGSGPGWIGLLLWMALLVTVRTAVQIGATRIELDAVFAFLAEHRGRLLRAVSQRSVPMHRAPWRGALASALDDGLENLGQGVAAGFRCLAAAAQALVLLPLLFLFSWKLAAAALVLAVPALLASRLRAGMLAASGRGWERSQSELAAEAEDFAEGAEASVGNGRIAEAAAALELGLEKHAVRARAWETAKAVFPPALEWFFFIALAALAGLAAAHADGRQTSPGPVGLLPFGALLLLLYRPIREWARHYPTFLLGGQAWLTLGNLHDTLVSFPARLPFAIAPGREIRIERLGFGYGHERIGPAEGPVHSAPTPPVTTRKVFDGLDLELDPEALTWISGPNGTGKSTLLKLLAGVESPQSGKILLPKGLGVLARPIGYLPQRAVVEPDWQGWSRAYRAGHAEDWAALDAILGVEAILAKASFDLKGLSGGERQRLCLARAFGSPCGYLLLDEPTTWLSASDRESIMGDLLAFWRTPRYPVVPSGGDPLRLGIRGAAIVSHEPFLGEFCARTVRLGHQGQPEHKKHSAWADGKPGADL